VNATGITRPGGGVACAEQRWNAAQLAQPPASPVARLWRYDAPAVVLGCSQRRLLATVDDSPELPVLLRDSGGGAVLVGPWMLGLSVALPAAHALVRGGPVPAYRWLGEALAGVLRRFGIAAAALPPGALVAPRADDPLAWACYGGLSPWEVVAHDRKLVGLAQVRRRCGVLLVGGLLLAPPPWALLCGVLGRPEADARALAARTTSVQEAAGHDVPIEALAAAVDQALVHAWQAEAAEAREPAPHRDREWACAGA
jgi:lipoate-protein ligase A